MRSGRREGRQSSQAGQLSARFNHTSDAQMVAQQLRK